VLVKVKEELWRTRDADPGTMEAQQRQATTMLVDELAGRMRAAAAGGGGSIPEDELNQLVAPHLPTLLGRSFPEAAGAVLRSSVKTEEQRAALLQLTEFVMGVHNELGDELSSLQWRQQEKLRELCDAAAEGGTERLAELAAAMKDELDTDFCNYLNYAIEQEETRLVGEGVAPFVPAAPPVVPLIDRDGDDGDDAPAVWQEVGAADDPGLTSLSPGGAPDASRDGESGGILAGANKAATQQWLLVLRLVRQGVYAVLAKQYTEDVKRVRYIMGLKSREARQHLTQRTLLEMSADAQEHFATTVDRIVDNLSVQRDARDAEIYEQVCQIQEDVRAYGKAYGVGEYGGL